MNFAINHEISASREAVIAAMINHSYYEFLGSQVSNIHAPELLVVTEEGNLVTMEVRYAFAGALSGPARMAVDPTKLTWVIRTELNRESGSGQVTMTPDHYNGLLSCSGSLLLEETATGCTESLNGELNVHLPLISHTAEVAIVQGLRSHLKDEAVAIAAFLQLPLL